MLRLFHLIYIRALNFCTELCMALGAFSKWPVGRRTQKFVFRRSAAVANGSVVDQRSALCACTAKNCIRRPLFQQVRAAKVNDKNFFSNCLTLQNDNLSML